MFGLGTNREIFRNRVQCRLCESGSHPARTRYTGSLRAVEERDGKAAGAGKARGGGMKRGKGAGLNERARYTNHFVSARMNDISIDSWQYLISTQSGKRQWNKLGNQMRTSAPIIMRDA